ncbi:hypothetical protein HHI36_016843 [Cryptolaemus montrouzieri]|uniref:Uncharacterized protein n=1 Tax=Cryptolaemus montrouzieri TaxID=559131 RepID=A0ABD2NKU4_9CUCU
MHKPRTKRFQQNTRTKGQIAVLRHWSTTKMALHALQINLKRSKDAHDLLYKSREHLGGDLVLVSEPNKNYIGAGRWITDNKKDSAIRVRKYIPIHYRGSGSGYC